MKIRLNEIPEEGRSYTLSREGGELNSALKDLIGQNSYQADIYIKSLNSKDFMVSGLVKTHTIEQCSTCGIEFNFPIQKRINDFLIPKQDNSDRKGHYAKINLEQNDQDVVEYVGVNFDLGEYLHEMIALEVPFNPKPTLKENGDCSVCLKPCGEIPFLYDEKLSVEVAENPFNALKGIKLN